MTLGGVRWWATATAIINVAVITVANRAGVAQSSWSSWARWMASSRLVTQSRV